MKIIMVPGCVKCPHGALWELDGKQYMCSAKLKVNPNGFKAPEWCPLQDALQVIKELVKKHATGKGMAET